MALGSAHNPRLAARASDSSVSSSLSFGGILPEPPRKASLHNLLIQISSIGQDHVSDCPPVTILTFGFDFDLFSEYLSSGTVRPVLTE